MAQQLTISPPSILESNALEGSEGEGREGETRLFFLEYLSRRADNDSGLRRIDAEVIHEERQQAAQAGDGCGAAVEVASRLANLGNSILLFIPLSH